MYILNNQFILSSLKKNFNVVAIGSIYVFKQLFVKAHAATEINFHIPLLG